jgi:hypothetical protein
MNVGRALGAIVASASVAALLWSPTADAVPQPRSVDLSGAFDQDCVAGQFKPLIEGDCTGAGIGATFITEKFPSGKVVLSGIPFTIGPTTGMSPNTASGKGQVLKVHAPAGYNWAQVLVTAVNQSGAGKAPGGLVATYVDGRRTTGRMGTYDWSNKGKASSAAITAPNENLISPAATQVSSIRYVWVESVPLNPRRALASLTLGADGTNLRVFAITLSAVPAQRTKTWTPQ